MNWVPARLPPPWVFSKDVLEPPQKLGWFRPPRSLPAAAQVSAQRPGPAELRAAGGDMSCMFSGPHAPHGSRSPGRVARRGLGPCLFPLPAWTSHPAQCPCVPWGGVCLLTGLSARGQPCPPRPECPVGTAGPAVLWLFCPQFCVACCWAEGTHGGGPLPLLGGAGSVQSGPVGGFRLASASFLSPARKGA